MRAERADLERGNRQFQVVDRAGGRGEVEDVIHVARDEDVFRHVHADEAEALVPGEVLDVFRAAGDEVIQGDDPVSLLEQALDEVRAEKARAAGDDGRGHFGRKRRERRRRGQLAIIVGEVACM